MARSRRPAETTGSSDGLSSRPKSVDAVHVEDARTALQDALGSCPLAEESLRHPTFSAVITVLLRLTAQGFAKGLFGEDELSRGSMVAPEAQAMLLAKLFALFGALTGTRVAIRPADVLAGTAPEQTLRFIGGLARLKTSTPPEVVAGAVRRVTDSMAAPGPARAAPKPKAKAKKTRRKRTGARPPRGVDAAGTTDPIALPSVSVVGGASSAGPVPPGHREEPMRAPRDRAGTGTAPQAAASPSARPPPMPRSDGSGSSARWELVPEEAPLPRVTRSGLAAVRLVRRCPRHSGAQARTPLSASSLQCQHH